jgi:hypothetical protein
MTAISANWALRYFMAFWMVELRSHPGKEHSPEKILRSSIEDFEKKYTSAWAFK